MSLLMWLKDNLYFYVLDMFVTGWQLILVFHGIYQIYFSCSYNMFLNNKSVETQEISFLNTIVNSIKDHSLVKYSKCAWYQLDTVAKTKNKRISETAVKTLS